MAESTHLTSAAINRHAHVNNVGDILEQLVDVDIGHIKWQVSDIESPGGSVTVGSRNEVEMRISCDNAPAFHNAQM